MKKLYVVTGPIGAGKSTLIPMIQEFLNIKPYIYINADIYLMDKYEYLQNDYKKRNELAKEDMKRELQACLDKGCDVLWETVVAKEDKVELIREFKNSDYYVTIIFVSINDVAICLNRVASRQEKLGYSIPESKIIKKYRDVYENLSTMSVLADEVWIVDNSETNTKAKFERKK